MRTVLLLTGGRSGSDFLQSLFDNHSEILQFPGPLKFDKQFIKIFNLKSDIEIAKYFIETNKHFFDSRLNKIERHDKLGLSKKEFYTVDREYKDLFIAGLPLKELKKKHNLSNNDLEPYSAIHYNKIKDKIF